MCGWVMLHQQTTSRLSVALLTQECSVPHNEGWQRSPLCIVTQASGLTEAPFQHGFLHHWDVERNVGNCALPLNTSALMWHTLFISFFIGQGKSSNLRGQGAQSFQKAWGAEHSE